MINLFTRENVRRFPNRERGQWHGIRCSWSPQAGICSAESWCSQYPIMHLDVHFCKICWIALLWCFIVHVYLWGPYLSAIITAYIKKKSVCRIRKIWNGNFWNNLFELVFHCTTIFLSILFNVLSLPASFSSGLGMN